MAILLPTHHREKSALQAYIGYARLRCGFGGGYVASWWVQALEKIEDKGILVAKLSLGYVECC